MFRSFTLRHTRIWRKRRKFFGKTTLLSSVLFLVVIALNSRYEVMHPIHAGVFGFIPACFLCLTSFSRYIEKNYKTKWADTGIKTAIALTLGAVVLVFVNKFTGGVPSAKKLLFLLSVSMGGLSLTAISTAIAMAKSGSHANKAVAVLVHITTSVMLMILFFCTVTILGSSSTRGAGVAALLFLLVLSVLLAIEVAVFYICHFLAPKR